MSKEDIYRRNAAASFALAQHAISSARKRRLLALADAWRVLADNARNESRRDATREHPLIRQKLDPLQPSTNERRFTVS